MRSPTFLSRAPIDTTPGQLPRIRIEEVAAVELSLPPLDVQQQVMEELSREMSAVKQLVDSLESQLTEIEELPAAYLQQAFNGEL
jgi:type I restriction enzyme S subunit